MQTEACSLNGIYCTLHRRVNIKLMRSLLNYLLMQKKGLADKVMHNNNILEALPYDFAICEFILIQCFFLNKLPFTANPFTF